MRKQGDHYAKARRPLRESNHYTITPKATITPLRESKATPENDKKSNVPNKDLLLKNWAVVVKRTVVRNIWQIDNLGTLQ